MSFPLIIQALFNLWIKGSFKFHCRKTFSNRIVKEIDSCSPSTSESKIKISKLMSLLHAIDIFRSTWETVTSTMIFNSFKSCALKILVHESQNEKF